MFSVIFEVHPRPERFDLYLDLAKGLRPILEGIDGFIDNERFESTHRRMDPLAPHLARRALADRGQASRYSAARSGRGVPGLPSARG
jgi:hypothetical protein